MKIGFLDSLTNLVSGLGTSKDKTTANRYSFVPLTLDQIEYAYRDEWLPRKIIDIPAKDATRAWRSWQASPDQISAIEDLEKQFGVAKKVRDALIKGRLYGGGAIVIGVDGAGAWDQPIDLERVRQGSLKFLHVVDRYELTSGEIEQDLLNPTFGQPKYYQSGSTGLVQIHPSRVVRLIGSAMPSRRLGDDGWGDSVLQAINSAIMQAITGPHALALMLQEANMDVIKIPGFMNSIGTSEYKSRIIERFQLAAVGQSIVRAKMLDSEEEWQRVATSFSSVPESVQLLLNVAAGAGDVPVTRLMGVSPGGLNATGESDIRNYYDNVSDQQENEISPAMAVLDEVIIRSALGSRPKEVFYDWRPLWQPTASEKADIRFKNSQTLVNIYNTGLVPDEALSKGALNMLYEDGLMPGLEQAVEEAGEDAINEQDPEAQEQFSASNDPASE